MTSEAFVERLAACHRVGLDLGVFEAWLGGDARLGPLGLVLFERIEAGTLTAVTSVLTLTELLVAPQRVRDEAATEELSFLLPTYPNLDLAPVTLAVATKAATYQARFGLDPITAIQVATAKVEAADVLITTDPGIMRLATELDVLLLNDFAGP